MEPFSAVLTTGDPERGQDNSDAADQTRRLIIEWAAQL
jgi:hypothetical protein